MTSFPIENNRSEFTLYKVNAELFLPLTIGNIKMSVLFTEKQDVIRLSLRSKDDFSVNDMSRKHFNGGGHLNAAGGTLYCSLEEAIEKFKSVLPEYKEALK